MTHAKLYCGDALSTLESLPAESVQCCVTSPPYWGLRDYGVSGQLGLEPTPEEYVAKMVAVFREVRRVLRDDGTLWLNMGDSYATQTGKGDNTPQTKWPANKYPNGAPHRSKRIERGTGRWGGGDSGVDGLAPKNLVGIPWRLAFALQADGWWLRSDIIWAKPNPMPESVTDRPTKSHEYVFLLSKAAKYYYDATAIAEFGVTAEKENYPARARISGRGGQGAAQARGNDRDKSGGFPPRKTDKQRGHSRRHAGFDRWDAMERNEQCGYMRNARTVWEIATQPYPQAHFATFPEELARRCIMAGTAPGDCVLDPFAGSGTVAQVATGNGRASIYIDLNPKYTELARQRIGPMLCEEVA